MIFFKKSFDVLKSNFIFLIVLGFLVYLKYPDFKKNSSFEGKKIESTYDLVEVTSGQTIHFPSGQQIVVFWASWCGPCSVELSRINNLIRLNKLKPEHVLAISVDENRSDLEGALKKNSYLFPIAHDISGELRQIFEVRGTPTILLVGSDKLISWRTTGISPLLEAKILTFIE